jgi:hypothetical protein
VRQAPHVHRRPWAADFGVVCIERGDFALEGRLDTHETLVVHRIMRHLDVHYHNLLFSRRSVRR